MGHRNGGENREGTEEGQVGGGGGKEGGQSLSGPKSRVTVRLQRLP